MNHIRRLTVVILSMIALFYITVGMLALHAVVPVSAETSCDRIVNYEDGSRVCQIILGRSSN